MLTDADVKKLITVFVTKDDLKEAVANLSTKADFHNLLTAVDAYTKKFDIYFKELARREKYAKTYKTDVKLPS